MSEGKFKFTDKAKIDPDKPPYVCIYMDGKRFKSQVGRDREDKHILYFCPFCGVRFASFMGNYAPTLEQEKLQRQTSLIVPP